MQELEGRFKSRNIDFLRVSTKICLTVRYTNRTDTEVGASGPGFSVWTGSRLTNLGTLGITAF